MNIGCARVSTFDQNLDSQMHAVIKVGCKKICPARSWRPAPVTVGALGEHDDSRGQADHDRICGHRGNLNAV
jgi:hypothetical protein